MWGNSSVRDKQALLEGHEALAQPPEEKEATFNKEKGKKKGRKKSEKERRRGNEEVRVIPLFLPTKRRKS